MEMIKLTTERTLWRTANQRFIRGRRLYVYFMRHRINAYRDDVIDYMQERMQERGLYSEKSDPRGVRQGILSHLCNIEITRRKGSFDWHEWLMQKGWDAWTGYSKPNIRMRA